MAFLRVKFLCRIVFCLILVSFCQLHLSAQTVSFTSDISRPIPGAGHNYVKGLNETVNPATGTLSISLPLPTPSSRGISLPLSLVYNSGVVHHPVVETYQGGTQVALVMDGGGILIDRSLNGWSDTIPYATAASWVIDTPPNQDGEEAWCALTSSYALYDSGGQSHQLGLTAIAPVQQYSGGVGVSPGYCTQAGYPATANWSANGYTGRIIGGTCNGTTSSGLAPDCYYASPPFTATDLDNTVYTFPGGYSTLQYGSSNFNSQTFPTTIEDRNGNIVNITAGHSDGKGGITPTVVKDTAGRAEIQLSYVDSNFSPASYVVGGLKYTVGYTTTSDNYTSPTLAVAPFPSGTAHCSPSFASHYAGKKAIQTIELPNGKAYTFSYDPVYGLLDEIDYPDGGYVKYTWKLNDTLSDFTSFPATNQAQGSNNLCNYQYKTPVVETREVGTSSGGSPVQTQTFTYSTTWSASDEEQWTTKTTTVVTNDNVTGKTTKTVYSYSPTALPLPPSASGTSAPEIPAERTVTTYDLAAGSQSGPLIETLSKTWSDPYAMTSEVVTLRGSASYKTLYQYDSNDRITEKDEFGYGQTSVFRKTLYSYYSSSYLGSAFSAPCDVIVQDGTGNKISEVIDYYDGGSVACTSGKAAVAAVSGLPSGTHDESIYAANASVVRGNVTRTVGECFSGCANVGTLGVYDETGQLTLFTDPVGNTVKYSYQDSPSGGNASGNSNAYLTQVMFPSTQGVVHNETYSYNYANGVLVKSIDQNSQSTTYQYADSLNRLTKTSYPDGGSTTIGYEDDVPVTVTTSVAATPSPTEVSTLVLDGLGRGVHQTGPDGNTVDTGYDGLGRVQSVSNPHGTSASPSTDGTTLFTYDVLGRKTIQTNQDATTQQWCYNGIPSGSQSGCTTNKSSDTVDSWVDYYDESSNHWQRVTDAFGRLTAVMEPNASNSPTIETDYGYNFLDDLVRVDQWGGAHGAAGEVVRTFAYDSFRRLTSASNAESGTVSYSYDAASNLKSRTDARGVITTYSYDALNRLTQKVYTSDPAKTPTVAYQYDQAPIGWGWVNQTSPVWTNVTPTNVIGRMVGVTVTSPNAWIVYGYDSMGRVNLKSECLFDNCGTDHYDFHYKYDLAGNMTFYDRGLDAVQNGNHPGQYYFGGFTQTFDAGGHLTALTRDVADANHPAAVMSNGFYNPLGRLSSATMLGVYKHTQTYSNRGWPLLEMDTDVSGSTVWSSNSSYWPTGSLKTAADSVEGSWSYTYDNLSRLATAASATTGVSFSYDAFGNRTSQRATLGSAPQTAFTYNANNRISSGYSYDSSGDLTNDGTVGYTYDAEGRLASEIQGGQTVATFSHDGEGDRTVGTVPSFPATLEYLYGINHRFVDVIESIGAGPQFLPIAVYAGGSLLAEDAGYGSSSAGTYLHLTDHVGTVRELLNASENISTECSSLPFGDARCSDQFLFFTGQQRDSVTNGLDYFGARHYNSTLGRFMSPDWSAKAEPIPYANLNNPQSLNLYTYVGNNPLSRTDPTGHYVCNGSKDQCAAIQVGLNLAKAAVNDLGVNSKEGKAIQKVIDFYGPMGKDNGVNVSFATMKPGELGQAVMGKSGSINITFDLQQINASGSRSSQFGERAGVAIHEGTHAVDERQWGHNPRTLQQEDWTEHNAYRNESFTFQGIGWPSADGLWYPGMTEAARNAAINEGAERSDAVACGGNPCD